MTLDERRAELLRIIGEDDVQVESPKWLTMMQSGVVVKLHIRRWRGKTRLDFADLGLDSESEDEVNAQLIKLGEKRLLPARSNGTGKEVSYVTLLDNLDAEARHLLENHSYETHWGRFVPYTRYNDWKKANEDIKAKYLAMGSEIYDQYDVIMGRLTADYGRQAQIAYGRLTTLHGMIDMTPTQFTTRFVDKIVALVPSKERIRDSFEFTTDVSYIPLPNELAQSVATAEQIERDAEIKREMDTNQITDLRRMNRDVVAQATASKSRLIDSFLQDVARQIRSLVYDVTTNVLDSVGKNGALVGKSSAQLANLIESVKGLNFYGDGEINQMITKVQGILDATPKDRNIDEVKSQLTDIGILTRASLLALGAAPRESRSLGKTVTSDTTMVREARGRLGLAAPTEAVTLTRQSRTL
jgi:hypothetical protein